MRTDTGISIQRLSECFGEPRASVGRWVAPVSEPRPARRRARPVADQEPLRQQIQALCDEPRHLHFGHRRICALLRRRFKIAVNRKTVLKVMRELGLTRAKKWHRPWRPKRIEKVNATALNTHWQIDMTSFQLSSMRPLFLVVVVDCCSREIVGYTLDYRCRAKEWVAALRQALESRGLTDKNQTRHLTLRSDNGAQPCSKAFVAYLGATGVTGEYTGYNAPDDNAFVERIMRTIKEEEIWPNLYDSFTEARSAIDEYMRWYNEERIHAALNYQTPSEMAAKMRTHNAA
ncbi:MAG: IS3 family transposase [Proteobacteria bacterium]|nr:IS3 family transposase [Pseudomonadota bacterium]